MSSELLQFAFSGITVGAAYALIALGFTLIYNASHVANFAQGDFVMVGAMTTVFLSGAGIPMPLAAVMALVAAGLTGFLLYRAAIEPAKGSSVLGMIILTIGASIFLKGLAQLIFDKRFHSLPSWFRSDPIRLFGATILPQSFVVLVGAGIVVVGLTYFGTRSLIGKGMIAVSSNSLAANLVGINTKSIVALAFVISAVIGGIAGVLATPITLTSYDVGTILSLKGFAAAMLGGMGSPVGAVVGGLVLGMVEAFGSGLISSAYKDAFAFLVILLVLFVRPQGFFGTVERERV